jgi:hypothetical protein
MEHGGERCCNLRSDDRRKIERMRNAESDIRQLIGRTLTVIAETKSVIRELDAMDCPVIDRRIQPDTGPRLLIVHF